MILRQAAFCDAGKFLKGALHCHTTRSDGKGDPAEVMRLHKAHGYDFMAITDHRLYNYQSFAPETGITVIPGMEMDRGVTTDAGMCFHSVCLGPDQEDGNPYRQEQRFESGKVADQAEYQGLLDELHAAKQMTVYCHPGWSCTPARSFEDMTGNFAMELWNSGCVINNSLDIDNGSIWDEMLMRGKRIWGIAVDDGHAMREHCNGWVMVNAENSVSAILEALKAGRFYASCGPEISDFYVEDGKAVVVCSPCESAQFFVGAYPTLTRRADGAPVTRHEEPLREGLSYVRAVVKDSCGRTAWTNPIFLG